MHIAYTQFCRYDAPQMNTVIKCRKSQSTRKIQTKKFRIKTSYARPPTLERKECQ